MRKLKHRRFVQKPIPGNLLRLGLIAAHLATGILHAQSPVTLQGFWLEPSGGIVQVSSCGNALCARIVAFSHSDGATTDRNNPDTSLRSRSLCGLEIASAFSEKDARHAESGHIYDPKTGKTFNAAMKIEGDTLRLRGYVGVKLFGKTEIWKPVRQAPAPCQAP